MNFFHKNRFLSWLLIVLILINVSALVSFFLFSHTKTPASCCPSDGKQAHSFCSELRLSEKQTSQVDSINQNYKANAGPIVAAIKNARSAILNELEKETPDTGMLNKLTDELSVLQKRVQQENIKQYLKLKNVCDLEQAQRLSALYRDLYGCPMKNNAMQHQYRHGQGNSKAGARCE